MNKIEELKEILKPYVTHIESERLQNINLSTDFIRDLEINSADLIDIILDIEEKYGIIINDEAMQKMLTVSNALAIIENELSKK